MARETGQNPQEANVPEPDELRDSPVKPQPQKVVLPKPPPLTVPKHLAMAQPTPSAVLAAAGKQILDCYREIEEAWAKAEELLSLSHVPTEVRVLVRPYGHNAEDPNEAVYLGYARHHGQWRICEISTDLESNANEGDSYYRPITECPFDRRLEMLDSFENLYAEVLKTTQDYVPKVKDRVTKFMASLGTLNRS